MANEEGKTKIFEHCLIYFLAFKIRINGYFIAMVFETCKDCEGFLMLHIIHY